MENIKPCRHHGKECGHFRYKVCDECVWERFEACCELFEIRERTIEKLRDHIKKIGALAGHPDAKEGCRHICVEVKSALEQVGGK